MNTAAKGVYRWIDFSDCPINYFDMFAGDLETGRRGPRGAGPGASSWHNCRTRLVPIDGIMVTSGENKTAATSPALVLCTGCYLLCTALYVLWHSDEGNGKDKIWVKHKRQARENKSITMTRSDKTKYISEQSVQPLKVSPPIAYCLSLWSC